jgi:hypothetical protein
VAPGGTVQFSATAYDQFAIALATQPKFTWTIVSGLGKVSSTGLYTAPTTKTGTATVQVSSGSVHARATVVVKRSGTTSNKSLVKPLL